MNNKRPIFLVGIVLLLCSISWAAPIPCPDGASYTTYLGLNAGGGCFIGDKLFTGFTYTSTAFGGATAIPVGGVTVTTIGPAGTGATLTGPEFGFQFSAPWFAGPGQGQDSLIGYTVSVVGPGPAFEPGPALINDLTLFFNGVHTQNGAASVIETVCLGASLAPCPGGFLTPNPFVSSDGGEKPQEHRLVVPLQSTIGITKDISLVGNAGTATISAVQNTFSQVPEPTSLLLIGSGLLGLGLVRRIRKAR